MTPVALHRSLIALVAIASVCALALAMAPAASAGQTCAAVRATPAQVGTQQLASSTVCLLNAQRARHGLRALRVSGPLSVAAQQHAADMERRRYFSHTSRDGSNFVQRIRRTGYLRRAAGWFVGENLAWGAGVNRSSPRGIVAAWMASPPHRRNILDGRFREIGIGVVEGAPRRNLFGMPAATYATSFGSRG